MSNKQKQNPLAFKFSLVFIALSIILLNFAGWSQNAPTQLQIRLGERLFRDARFSAPQGDLPASCSNCHLFDEDPQGLRPYADFFNRSWISYRTQSPQRFELRNSPALLDVAAQSHLHYDGEFASLEDLVKGTFSGRPMGWLPSEQAQAFAQMQKVVQEDVGDEPGKENYRAQFKKAYNVELEKLSQVEVANFIAHAVADFMRTLKSQMRSPYDEFRKANNLPTAPAVNESAKLFGAKFLVQIAELEKSKTIKFSSRFDATALQGLKIFMRTDGENAAGNCVTCHAPPLFTDFSYHNLGISQMEYDQIHGAGTFAELQIPGAETTRPNMQRREIPAKNNPALVDLGYWNFVNIKTSTLRRSTETDDQFLARMIGTMKTPGLRHLAYTYPYMHNGAYTTLVDAIKELQQLSEMARAGQVRAADEELLKIHIRDAEITPLLAFLHSLNEDLKRNYQQAKR